MSDIQILGTLTGVAGEVLELAGIGGYPKDVAIQAAKGAVLVAAPAEAREQVQAVVAGLGPSGSKRDALAALYPNLPARHLSMALALIDGLTAAVANDGRVDAGELLGLVSAAIREELA